MPLNRSFSLAQNIHTFTWLKTDKLETEKQNLPIIYIYFLDFF